MPYKIIIFSKQFCSLFHEAIVKEYFPMCSRIEERCSLGLFFESVRQSCVRGRRLSKGCQLLPRKKLRASFNLYFQSTDANLLGKIDIYTYMNSIRDAYPFQNG